mmetsp:Transcript_64096/g.77069  ORF Transcript_64096/g.77069 Transcript_64096/m.77069 type:complete len:95 (+) Transcript_64096:107-391(+)
MEGSSSHSRARGVVLVGLLLWITPPWLCNDIERHSGHELNKKKFQCYPVSETILTGDRDFRVGKWCRFSPSGVCLESSCDFAKRVCTDGRKLFP